jgi:hypothetical protein
VLEPLADDAADRPTDGIGPAPWRLTVNSLRERGRVANRSLSSRGIPMLLPARRASWQWQPEDSTAAAKPLYL